MEYGRKLINSPDEHFPLIVNTVLTLGRERGQRQIHVKEDLFANVIQPHSDVAVELDVVGEHGLDEAFSVLTNKAAEVNELTGPPENSVLLLTIFHLIFFPLNFSRFLEPVIISQGVLKPVLILRVVISHF